MAIVGATGAGKTSIINLILRFYEIQEGRILLYGEDIRELDSAFLRSQFGLVMQDVFLFAGNIKGNIVLGNGRISQEELETIVHHVNADRFIERLPLRYNEVVREGGVTLSSGERQLLAFARALAINPKILILDEATSNIDTETERLIQDALARLMKDRTSLVIAHRLSTIQNCDRISVQPLADAAREHPQSLLEHGPVGVIARQCRRLEEAARLLGELPELVQRQPIAPVPWGKSFASTSGETPLHSDSQLCFGDPPDLQLMFCERAASAGGESTLLDSWPLLDAIARDDPELHQLLFSEIRRIPFVFGDVVGPTVSLRRGALVFTHSPKPLPNDPIARRLAPHLERAPQERVRPAEGEVLVAGRLRRHVPDLLPHDLGRQVAQAGPPEHMRYLSLISGTILFLLALGFALKNSDSVTLYYFLGYQWQAPLILILMVAFCLGTAAGIAATLGLIFRQRREIQQLRREIKSRMQPSSLHLDASVQLNPK